MTPNDLLGRLLYRDPLMLVIDKPSGLPVHAGPGGGPNLEALFDGLRFGLPRPPSLAHRLDRETSGCLVLGRHRKALRKLGRLFAEGTVAKTYWAITQDQPAADGGRIELPLVKQSRRQGGWRMVVSDAGQASITEWRVLARSGRHALLELRPLTGRTHQIRVHCAAMGFPLAGDWAYGSEGENPAQALLLHARRIVLPLYPSRAAITVVAPLPAPFDRRLAELGIPVPDDGPVAAQIDPHQDRRPA
jgi:tRNA pseudouridine32 synthase/23S rRNA pseudouridine746 synthase/23S rRNA pseudouridine1911/1915/1917 synthase